jgi:hypothetical protein
MSEFSPDWLRLREPADHRARDKRLMKETARLLDGKPAVRIVDLGSGLGSNLRALSPHIRADQDWRLLDHDAMLLAAARRELCAWGESIERDGVITMHRDDHRLTVRTETLDLFHDTERIFHHAPDLVTAAALFDLVSPQWIDGLADILTRHRVPFYTALTYDGRDEGDPPHPLDGPILKALHIHQHRDKGFGPAAGPHAIDFLRDAFVARGYRVSVAASPWILGDDDSAMLTMLGKGVAHAVAETGLVSAEDIAEWMRFRMADGRWRGVRWTVGHADLLAAPQGER